MRGGEERSCDRVDPRVRIRAAMVVRGDGRDAEGVKTISALAHPCEALSTRGIRIDTNPHHSTASLVLIHDSLRVVERLVSGGLANGPAEDVVVAVAEALLEFVELFPREEVDAPGEKRQEKEGVD